MHVVASRKLIASFWLDSCLFGIPSGTMMNLTVAAFHSTGQSHRCAACTPGSDGPDSACGCEQDPDEGGKDARGQP